LTREILPAILMRFPSQEGSLPAHLSSRCWKSLLLRLHRESGKPRYLKGNKARVAGILSRISSRSILLQRMGATDLFIKLVARPVTSPKLWRMVARF
jgi:hypothetical protein